MNMPLLRAVVWLFSGSMGEPKPESFDVRVSFSITHCKMLASLAENSERYTLADLGFAETDLEKWARLTEALWDDPLGGSNGSRKDDIALRRTADVK